MKTREPARTAFHLAWLEDRAQHNSTSWTTSVVGRAINRTTIFRCRLIWATDSTACYLCSLVFFLPSVSLVELTWPSWLENCVFLPLFLLFVADGQFYRLYPQRKMDRRWTRTRFLKTEWAWSIRWFQTASPQYCIELIIQFYTWHTMELHI
jgi:hypothetical protein